MNEFVATKHPLPPSTTPLPSPAKTEGLVVKPPHPRDFKIHSFLSNFCFETYTSFKFSKDLLTEGIWTEMKLIQLINRPIDNFYIVPQANGQFWLPIRRMTRTLVIYILTLPSNSKDNITCFSKLFCWE